MNKNMPNEPNLRQSQIFITAMNTTSYNEKSKLDTWSKQTQTKPISNRTGDAGRRFMLTRDGPSTTLRMLVDNISQFGNRLVPGKYSISK
jgi:hypothetical protein